MYISEFCSYKFKHISFCVFSLFPTGIDSVTLLFLFLFLAAFIGMGFGFFKILKYVHQTVRERYFTWFTILWIPTKRSKYSFELFFSGLF